MLLLAGLVVGLLAGVATGGRLGNLARLSFRWPWLVLLVLIVREATLFPPLNGIEGVQYVYAVALTALVMWTIWHVDRVPGIWLVAAGATLNLVAVAVNGARMPVAPELAGRLNQTGHLGQYVLMGSGTNLNWLGDWIGVAGRGGDLIGAYSPGDVLVAIGIGVVAFFAARSKLDGTSETSARIGS